MQNVFAPHDHANCTHSALTTVERACAERGLRLTPIRKRTLEILLEGHHALGAYDVLQKLSDDGLADKPPMAYRALNFLVEHGFAHRVERLNAYIACTHPDADHTPALWICLTVTRLRKRCRQRNWVNALDRRVDFRSIP